MSFTNCGPEPESHRETGPALWHFQAGLTAQVYHHSHTDHFRAFEGFNLLRYQLISVAKVNGNLVLKWMNENVMHFYPSNLNSFAQRHTLSGCATVSGLFRGFPLEPGSKESALLSERLTTWVMHRCKSSLRQQWKHQICVTLRKG